MNSLLAERTSTLFTCFLISTSVSLGGMLHIEDIEARTLLAGDWLIEVVEDKRFVGGFVSLRVGPDDLPHVEYSTDLTQSLFYGKRNETEWFKESVDDTGNVHSTEGLAIGQNGNPHICYVKSQEGLELLQHTFPTQSGWGNETVEKTDEVNQYCSIFVDESDEYHISYQTYSTGRLWYAHFNGSGWSNEVVDESFNVGGWSSMAVGPSGAPSIAYEDYQNHSIRYAIKENGRWNISVANPDQKSGLSKWPSLDFNPDGKPHIVYVGRGVLKMTSKIGAEWVDKEILPYDAPQFPHMKMSSSGIPKIVYWAGGKLNYTSKPQDEWLTETLMEVELSGTATAIDLDSKDKPHLAFVDHRNGILYYATKANFSENLPPLAESGGPYIGTEGSEMTFSGYGSNDPEGRQLSFAWDFDSSIDSDGDGNFTNDVDATGPTPVHTYYDNSDYTVTLTVTDDTGQSDIDTCVATVLNVIPTANADGPHEGDEPHTVQFTGTFTDPGTLDTHTFQWDFDFDGIKFDINSTQQNPSHQWQDDFDGDVAFKVIDDDGGWDLDVTHVTVHNVPPEATANGPYQGFEGSPVKFTGDHTDPGPLDTHTYEWDFDYDGMTFTPDTTGNPSQKTWYDDYSGNTALKVTDDDGGWDLDVTTVTIENVPPTAEAGADKEGYEGSAITFNGSFYDPGTADTHTFEWDFEYDGITFDIDATGQSVSHTWPDDFDGYVAFRVTDDDGGIGIDTAHVLVKNVLPTVELEVLPIEVNASLRIAGEKWHDVTIELYEDGTPIFTGSIVRYPGSPDDQMLDMSDLQIDVSKRYATTVQYTPEDDPINGQPNGATPCWIILGFNDGQEVWLHHTFNVQHPEGYVWEVDLTAAILSHGITFKATASDPGADDLTVHWDFGDGTNVTNIYPNPNRIYPVSIVDTITHTFPGNGTFTIIVTVEDDDGGTVQVSHDLTI
jgi:PKD repeat protein